MPTYNAENFSLANCIKVRKLITDFTPVNTGRLEADGRKFYSVEATVRYLKEHRYTLLSPNVTHINCDSIDWKDFILFFHRRHEPEELFPILVPLHRVQL